MADILNKGYIVKSYQSLLTHGNKRLREVALAIIQSGINGADPGVGTNKAIKLTGNILSVGKRRYDLRSVGRVYVVGAGKGAPETTGPEEVFEETREEEEEEKEDT